MVSKNRTNPNGSSSSIVFCFLRWGEADAEDDADEADEANAETDADALLLRLPELDADMTKPRKKLSIFLIY
jgi:hypothetical protein